MNLVVANTNIPASFCFQTIRPTLPISSKIDDRFVIPPNDMNFLLCAKDDSTLVHVFRGYQSQLHSRRFAYAMILTTKRCEVRGGIEQILYDCSDQYNALLKALMRWFLLDRAVYNWTKAARPHLPRRRLGKLGGFSYFTRTHAWKRNFCR